MSTTVKDGNAADFEMNSTSDALNKVEFIGVSRSYAQAVTMGQIDGVSSIDKFGENPSIDTGTKEDIWEAGGEYIWDPDGTAPIVSLISDDAADAQDIRIDGLDITGAKVTQIITLTGTTRVVLSTPLWRVNIMENDGAVDLQGTVYCYTGTSTGGAPPLANQRAVIDNGNNRTLMALYTIPLGKVGFLCRGEIGISRSQTSGNARCAYYSRRFGKVFTIKKRVDLVNSGSSLYQDERCFPDVIPAKTDIKLTVESVSANNTGIFGTFDIMLVDENKFSSEFLTAIGQPS